MYPKVAKWSRPFFWRVEKGSWDWRLSGYLNIAVSKVCGLGTYQKCKLLGPIPTCWTWTSGGKAQQSVLRSPPSDCDASLFETTLLRNTSYLKTVHLVHEPFLPHPCRMDCILPCHLLCLLQLFIHRILWCFFMSVSPWQPAHPLPASVSHLPLQFSRT